MERELNYDNKTAIEALLELCLIRNYPQPLFLDRTMNNKIIVTTIVGGKIYGTSEGDSIPIACEQAAKITLSLWLGDKFNPSLLKSINNQNNQNNGNNNNNGLDNSNGNNNDSNNNNNNSNNNNNNNNSYNNNNNNNGNNGDNSNNNDNNSMTLSEIAAAAAENSQSNSVSLLHLYLTSTLSDIASKPDYILTKTTDGFLCELNLNCNQSIMKVTGTGKNKVQAKREAAFEFLKIFFPNASTIEQMMEEVNTAIELKKNEKKGGKSKSSTISSTSSITTTTTTPTTIHNLQKDDTSSLTKSNIDPTQLSTSVSNTALLNLNVFDELSDTVYEVVNNLSKYNISLPNNYSIRLATENDADIILSLILELATYEKSPESATLSRDELLRDGWGINRKYPTTTFRPDFYVYLVDYTPDSNNNDNNDNNNNNHNNNTKKKITVGMSLFYQIYSTWKGRSIHLEDLYVQEIHRAQGLGTILMRAVGAVVLEMNMKRYQWQCLTWNTKPRQFYNSLGAFELSDWMSIRMESNEIESFVQNGRPKISKLQSDNNNNNNNNNNSNDMDEEHNNTNENLNESNQISWTDLFRNAQKIGSLCDKDLEDFNVTNHSTNNDNDDDNDNDNDDNDDDDNQNSNGKSGTNGNNDTGGFCQPSELASFVASELKISNSNDLSLSSRTKRAHNSSEVEESELNNTTSFESKRYKSES